MSEAVFISPAQAEKCAGLLGLCRRAGRLSSGHDAALAALLSGKAWLCLLSRDASERLEREFERAAQSTQPQPVPVLRFPLSMQAIGHATGQRSAVLTVNDAGFSRAIQQTLQTQSNNNREESPYDQ